MWHTGPPPVEPVACRSVARTTQSPPDSDQRRLQVGQDGSLHQGCILRLQKTTTGTWELVSIKETGVCTCERNPDSLVKALQPLVTLTRTVGEEEVGSGTCQHVSVSCKHSKKGLSSNSCHLTQQLDLFPNHQMGLFCSFISKKSVSKNV